MRDRTFCNFSDPEADRLKCGGSASHRADLRTGISIFQLGSRDSYMFDASKVRDFVQFRAVCRLPSQTKAGGFAAKTARCGNLSFSWQALVGHLVYVTKSERPTSRQRSMFMPVSVDCCRPEALLAGWSSKSSASGSCESSAAQGSS